MPNPRLSYTMVQHPFQPSLQNMCDLPSMQSRRQFRTFALTQHQMPSSLNPPTCRGLRARASAVRVSVLKRYAATSFVNNQGDKEVCVLKAAARDEPSGSCTIAVGMHRIPRTSRQIISTLHLNVVELLDMWHDPMSSLTFFIYEAMDVSLEQILSLEQDPWAEGQVGEEQRCAMCCQVSLQRKEDASVSQGCRYCKE